MSKYLMENEEESLRLEMKTENRITEQQAKWAGLKPGMRVADIGCGTGKTTAHLHHMVQPSGEAVGIDSSQERIEYAKENYGHTGTRFSCHDISAPLDSIGKFDFIWVRFFLEYHRSKSFDIVKSLTEILKPGGILCLIDLDYNCMNHYGQSKRLKKALKEVIELLEKNADFDPYIGIKLYSYLYDQDYENINVHLSSHHLIYGELNETDSFNWTTKVEVAGKNSGYGFEEYDGGYEEFFEEFKNFFNDPRRFTYTPIISCRGVKPSS
ncbi:MAG: class I SAM-dependent methyltransferase [Deltaproteobacteria bacterium]|nr:class I SAM-dependent methyltransferase [Deltaproteobacteria bacterium]MBW2220139.1 class I SAM-dependent methyltransferase [Deltaproteobacteria bacterium]